MSEVEIITDGGRRRRWSSAEKLRIVEETLDGSESISAVARRNGVAPNLLYRWRKLMLEGGSIALAADDSVTRCPAGDCVAICREGATRRSVTWKPASVNLNASSGAKRWKWKS